MRQFLNRFGAIILIVTVVIAAVAIWINLRGRGQIPAGNPDLAFYIDEVTGEESVQSADLIPPLPGKGGADNLVIEAKYQSDLDKAPKTFFLIKYAPEVREKVQGLQRDDLTRLNALVEAEFVRSPQPGSPWIRLQDASAEPIITVPEAAPGHPRIQVYPAKP